jgi:hypothetical protein
VLENLSLKGRDARATRVAFQEAIIATTRRETSNSSIFPIAEQTRGNILLKEWERNISKGKQQSMKLRKYCEEIFGLLSEICLGFDGESGMDILGQINTAKYMLNIKENEERELAEISQITQTDIVQIDKWLIKPSMLLCSINAKDHHVEGKLSLLMKDCYIFQENNQAEPSKLISHLVEKCIICTKHAKRQVLSTK